MVRPAAPSLRTVTLLVYAAVAAVLVAAAILVKITGLPAGFLTRDPANATRSSALLGVVSTTGLLVWSAGLAGAFIAWRLAREVEQRRFILAFTVLTALLLLDDAYLIHDRLLPRKFGIPGEVTYLTYAALAGWIMLAHRDAIRRTERVLPLQALGWFAVSLVVDAEIFAGAPRGWWMLLEDGTKLAGIACWSTYGVRLALHAGAAEPIAERPPAVSAPAGISPMLAEPVSRTHAGHG